MDINDWRSLSVVLVMIAFIGICWWAFAPSRRGKFRDAANLPFADEKGGETSQQQNPTRPLRDESEQG